MNKNAQTASIHVHGLFTCTCTIAEMTRQGEYTCTPLLMLNAYVMFLISMTSTKFDTMFIETTCLQIYVDCTV